MNIVETFFDDSHTLFLEMFKLSWGSESISYRHTHYTSHTFRYFTFKFELLWIIIFIAFHFGKNLTEGQPVWIFRIDDTVYIESVIFEFFIEILSKINILGALDETKMILILLEEWSFGF